MTWLDTAITAALIIYSFFIVIILIEYVSDRRGKKKQLIQVKKPKEKLIPVTVERKSGKIGKKNKLKMPSEDRSPGVEKALKKMKQKQKKPVKAKSEKVSLVDPKPDAEVLDDKGAPEVWKERNFE